MEIQTLSQGQRGFTLIELLVVVAIMLALVSLFPVAFDRMMPARRVAAAAHQVASALREIESIAAGRGEIVRVTVEANTLYVRNALHEKPRKIEFKSSILLNLGSNTAVPHLSELVVYPDGSTNGGYVEVSDGTRHARVRVSALTGHVRVET